MVRFFAALLALTLAVFTYAAPASAQSDLDCYQFGSWQAAQDTYEAIVYNDGWDWMHLDEDGDGLACECLYYGYQCWTPWG